MMMSFLKGDKVRVVNNRSNNLRLATYEGQVGRVEFVKTWNDGSKIVYVMFDGEQHDFLPKELERAY
jgi:ATP-dependent exoDNAse (exonuclease V) alpha subunit